MSTHNDDLIRQRQLKEVRDAVALAEREVTVLRRAAHRYARTRNVLGALTGVAVVLTLTGVGLTFLNAIALPTNVLRPVIIACYVVGGVGTAVAGLAFSFYTDEASQEDSTTYGVSVRITPQDRLVESEARLARRYEELNDVIMNAPAGMN